MAKSLLEQLKEMTVVVADTGDFESIEKFKPQDTTTNPSLLTAAASMPQYQPLVDEVLLEAKKQLGPQAKDSDVANLAFRHLAVAFGKKILAIVPGRVSTEVDARLSFDTEGTMKQAHEIIKQYDEAGISRERILIKIASTWPGIKAAEQLEKEGIHCNLTLLFSFAQAVACAEAKVTLISPFVGRIYDFYLKDRGVKDIPPAMGASFRNIGEIRELAGCDLLTIAPKLLEELQETVSDLPRKLDAKNAPGLQIEKIPMNEAIFEKMHAEDRMAHDKLKEGIEGFSAALEKLEKLLADRLAKMGAGKQEAVAAR